MTNVFIFGMSVGVILMGLVTIIAIFMVDSDV